ncbi:MAG: RNA-directed DNA polymerase [Mariniblastus sp.]|jgi:RNA-directed DNA polymerase
MQIWYTLYDRLLDYRALARAFAKVLGAKGAPGVDGQTLQSFGSELRDELNCLLTELRTKTYRPQPVRRVTIPKPNGGQRHLGIPAVRDRVVQQALLNILQPIFDPTFHPSSYGYRPGRSCQQAVAKATMFIRQYGRKHVVDMDLSKCFDRLDHELIITSIRRRITDGSILNLVRLFLESGVLVDVVYESTEIGSPQGGVISPLIANICLDAFDQEMKSRGQRIVRYADDILILCQSKSAAEHALQVATKILEVDLKLTVNRDKTHLAHASKGVKFLGVIIGSVHTRIVPEKVVNFQQQVKRITRRNSPVNLAKVIADLNPVLRGWGNYFRMANCKSVFRNLAGLIRRRLRAKQLALWKKPNRLIRRLRQVGWQGDLQKMRMTSWRTSRSSYASMAISNSFLAELGLYDLASIETGVLPDLG